MYRIPHDSIPVAHRAITLKDTHLILLQEPTMATDPVCLMIVDEDETKFTSVYKEHMYYFCCNWCKKKFEENPRRYSRLAHDVSVDLKQVT
jgi:YHS domain-containing protein